jgi:hypothetical protein
MPSSPSTGGGASNRSGAPWRPSRLVRDHGCGMLACPETGAVLFMDPWSCPRGRFIFGPSRGRSLRSLDGLAFEDAFGVSRPGFHQAPLLGFSKTAPPSTHALDVHSRVRPFRLPGRVSRFGLPLPGTSRVPPSRFLTALTAFSVVRAAGLLHPAADPGVHRVGSSALALRPGERPSRCVTLRRVSLASSLPLSPGSCPLIVRHPRTARSRGLALLVESVASTACCHSVKPDPPMGFSSSSLVRLTLPRGSGSRRTSPLREGPASLGERRVGGSPKRLQDLCSSSRSHHPGTGWAPRCGLWEATTASRRPAGASSGVFQGVGLSPSLAGRSVAPVSWTLGLFGFR